MRPMFNVQYLHSHAIVHRDIKPANIIRRGRPSDFQLSDPLRLPTAVLQRNPGFEPDPFVTPSKSSAPSPLQLKSMQSVVRFGRDWKDGPLRDLVLVDFGCCKVVGENCVAIAGTGEYAAPEQFTGNSQEQSCVERLPICYHG